MRIGVLGGGQLAQMLARAAAPLGLETLIYDANKASCAFAGNTHICADFTDTAQLELFAKSCDLITCEFESIPGKALELVSTYATCLPDPASFATGANRLKEKACFVECGMQVPHYVAIHRLSDCEKAASEIGFPLMAKTASGGYDGKGQSRCEDLASLESWFRSLDRPAIAESLVDFDHELSILIARKPGGETCLYPPVFIHQHQGVLHLATPCSTHPLAAQASTWATRLADRLDYTGLLALEMFVDKSGRLYANEFAPRVHNSGHWSIEGAATSQFSQHLRAICNLPFGSAELAGQCIMINLLGRHADFQADHNTHIHHYGKAVLPGRKVGHITLTRAPGESASSLLQRAADMYNTLYGLPLPSGLSKALNTTGASEENS